MLEVLYYHAKFDGARISPAARVAKSVEFLDVRPMLSGRCLSVCLCVLSVTLVYCGQTVGRIQMKLGVQVGLGPGHIAVSYTHLTLPTILRV